MYRGLTSSLEKRLEYMSLHIYYNNVLFAVAWVRVTDISLLVHEVQIFESRARQPCYEHNNNSVILVPLFLHL